MVSTKAKLVSTTITVGFSARPSSSLARLIIFSIFGQSVQLFISKFQFVSTQVGEMEEDKRTVAPFVFILVHFLPIMKHAIMLSLGVPFH